MRIYKLLIFLLLSSQYSFAFSAEDLASFCFESDVSLRAVRESIDFILVDNDKVAFRNDENCLDILTSDTRKKILDKYLTRKYQLKNENTSSTLIGRECHLEFKTISQKKIISNTANLGKKTNLAVSNANGITSSTASLLLGAGLPGSLGLATQTLQKIGEKEVLIPGSQNLQVTCRPNGLDGFDLTFYFDEKNKTNISTSIFAKANEVINFAGVVNTLNEKSKTLGFPQTTITTTDGNEETSYELKVY